MPITEEEMRELLKMGNEQGFDMPESVAEQATLDAEVLRRRSKDMPDIASTVGGAMRDKASGMPCCAAC